jgi:hypothetical protein
VDIPQIDVSYISSARPVNYLVRRHKCFTLPLTGALHPKKEISEKIMSRKDSWVNLSAVCFAAKMNL